MSVERSCLGACGTVTGSKYLVEGAGKKLLIDAGMFQGQRKWRERNWQLPPVSLDSVDAVLLTHAHIDHTGILPRFDREGLHCPVFATAATTDLAEILLPDSGRLQEEYTEYVRDKGYSRYKNPQPLYTERDAKEVLQAFHSVKFEERKEVLPGIYATWRRMGHILGAASIFLEIGGRSITFSGDVGRYQVPILKDPQSTDLGDLLLIESTYGSRQHVDSDLKSKLAGFINTAHDRGGMLLIPSFAVGRTQLILYYIRELKQEGRIPDLPVIIDSPMAKDATALYREHVADYDQTALAMFQDGVQPFTPSRMHFTRSRTESIKLNSIVEPMVLISASGMLSGGRILHHLKHRISSPLNTLLFVGYQPPGGTGDWLLSGADSVRILGREYAVRADIRQLSGLSAHGDKQELLTWCRSCNGEPGQVAVVHGEEDSRHDFARTLTEELKWNAVCPDYLARLEV